MNINLISTSPNVKETPPEHEDLLISDIENIPASMCSSVVIDQTLNALTNEQLELILSKIRHGGTISISSPDAVRVSKALYVGDIDIPQFTSLIIDSKSQHSILDMKTFFEQRGYNIEMAYVQGLSFYIKVQRP